MEREPHRKLSTPISPNGAPCLRPSLPDLSTFADEQTHLPAAETPPNSPKNEDFALMRPGTRRQIAVAQWLQARSSSPDQIEATVTSPPQHKLSFHSLVQALHQHNQNCSSPMPELFTQDTLRAPPPSPIDANTPTAQQELLIPITDQQPVRAAILSPSRPLLTTRDVILGALGSTGFMLISSGVSASMPKRGLPLTAITNTGLNAVSTGVSLAGTFATGGSVDSAMMIGKLCAGIALIVVIRQTLSRFDTWVHAACHSREDLLEQKFNERVDANQRITQQLFNDFDATTNEKIRLFTQQVVRAIEQVRAEQHNGMTLVARTFSSVSDVLERSQQPQSARLTLQPTQSRPQNTTLAITARAQNPTMNTQQVPLDTQVPGTTNLTDAAQAFRQAATEMQDMAAKAQETQQVIDIPAPILTPQVPQKKEKTTCSSCCQLQ